MLTYTDLERLHATCIRPALLDIVGLGNLPMLLHNYDDFHNLANTNARIAFCEQSISIPVDIRVAFTLRLFSYLDQQPCFQQAQSSQ